MSSDVGIYILQTLKGYRVIEAQAIDNIYFWHKCCNNPRVIPEELDEDNFFYHEICLNCNTRDPEAERRKEINPRMLLDYFGKCTVYDTEQEALEEACDIYEEITNDDFGIIEYGISFIRGWEDKIFPDKDIGENDE